MDDRRVLERAAALGIDYVESVPGRPVRPSASIAELRTVLDVPLPDGPVDAHAFSAGALPDSESTGR